MYLLSVRQTADQAWRVGYAPEGDEEGGIKGWVTAITKDGVENFRVRPMAAAAESPPGRKSTAATSRVSSAAKGSSGASAATERVMSKSEAKAEEAAERRVANEAMALKERRAREEAAEKAKQAAEAKKFEEKAKKLADEKAKKDELERKKLEEAQRKVKKEAEEKRAEEEKKDAEAKAKAKKEYESKIAADKAEANKHQLEKDAKFAAAAKAARDEKQKAKEQALKEKEASDKLKASLAGGGGGGEGATDQSAMTDEEKDSAAAMQALRSTTASAGMTEMDRKEAHRPAGRPEGQLSRHESVTEPASMLLMFNCSRSGFKLSKGDISSLPESEAIELRSTKSLVSMGRCKIAPSKGTEFVDRVDFPNEWRVGNEHGLIHDGLQGDGEIELRIDWKVENPLTGALEARVALLLVNPWLAYGCSEGARLSIRKAGSTEGRCATVQRALRDDSVVVRVDGMVGESTVDPSPLTVVTTTSPRHQPGTRLLFVHENNAVDAEVMEWGQGQGKDAEVFDIREGSRHRLLVQGSTMTGWVTVTKKNDKGVDVENLKIVEKRLEGENIDPEKEQLIVSAAKPLIMRSGFNQDTEKIGVLNPRIVVVILETRYMEDGAQRCMVSSVAGESVLITAALNEFNHSVQRFKNVADFEAARLNYLEDIVEREAMVEDAITGNMLRIKDQTLHVSTATDVVDNLSIPTEWRVNDVRDLVTLLLVPSPNRVMGTHSAQPTLVRAGPGTGKTWMTKQAVFTLADRLRSGGGGAKDGIRLVPVVVFVQRIVYLVREGQNASGAKFDLLPRYIESVYSGKKYETWREMLMQAYEMRALIVLLDGVDEAAGLRDEIEAFVHKELVPSGNRVLVTSRPEGVTLSLYMSRFVIMNLNELTNAQQRSVINIQMQGSQFFDHLLSLGEVRKGLDEAYYKLKEGVRSELEALFSDDRFRLVVQEEEAPKKVDGAPKGDDEPPKAGAPKGEVAAKPDAPKDHAVVPKAAKGGEEDGEPPVEEKKKKEEDIRYDPAMRQSGFEGTGVIIKERQAGVTGSIHSKVLLNLDRQMKSYTPQRCGISLLDRLDAVIAKLTPSVPSEIFEEKVLEDMLGFQGVEMRHKIALKLGNLMRQRQQLDAAGGRGKANVPALQQWEKILLRTDEVYCLATEFQPIFAFAMKQVVMSLAGDNDDPETLAKSCIMGEVKDPVRIHEKAISEYGTRFTDGGLAESCVTDVLRMRVACRTGTHVLNLVGLLNDGARIEIDDEASVGIIKDGMLDGGEPDKDEEGNPLPKKPRKKKIDPETGEVMLEAIDVQMVQMHNKFADLDPTHFRLAVCVLQLTFRDVRMFVEVEVHYEDVMKIALDENSSAYDHYNFFRQRLAGTVPENELDELLEEKLVFLVDATGIPVLLSLLVLIFTSGGEDLTKLPSNRIELYELGIESAIAKRLVRKGQEGIVAEGGTDLLVHEWMRLFNLDRGQSNVVNAVKSEKKGEREHKPTRKAAMKFEDLRGNSEYDAQKKTAEASSQGQSQEKAVFKLTPNEVYEVFKHGAHYLREAVKPEVQRTELNRIELLMPKKLVDTVMMLVNANLKMLLGERAQSFGLTMLRNVAVTNQQNGRREFSSAHVSQALLLDIPNPEGLTLWLHLNKEEGGLPLTKTLEAQTEAAPAQYQFKHLSFQEGLFAQHLLLQAQDGWEGWATDEMAAKFLNNPFMNNTCRIAAGHLGTPLAKRRPLWDFSITRLTETGLQALWLIMDKNEKLTMLNLQGNAVGKRETDAAGMARMLMTSTALTGLNLGSNHLGELKHYLRHFGRGLSVNKTLTELDVSNNKLGPDGIRAICTSLRTTVMLKKLQVSYNNPGREPALSELLRNHPGLRSIGVVEAEPMSRMERTFHLDARAKEMIGRALLESDSVINFLQCDIFSITEKTTTLPWRSASQCDAVMLAGVLKANRVLTEITMAPGGDLGESEREELGRALLSNTKGKLGYCDIYGLKVGSNKASFDVRDKEQVRSLRSFVMLCGLLRANQSLTQLTLRSLAAEHVEVLAEALQTNSTLESLNLEHPGRGNDLTLAVLPVQELNGNRELEHINLCEAGFTVVVEPNRTAAPLFRWAQAVTGSLLAVNQTVESLSLNPGSGSDGGGILEHLQRAQKSTLRTLDLTKINLGDRGGTKFFEALQQGQCLYLEELKLSGNKLSDSAIGLLFVQVLGNDACKLTSLDISNNSISATVLARAIKLNRSLTSLDIRDNPIEDDGLWLIGGLLLQEDCQCKLRSIMCSPFQVQAGAEELLLRDTRLEPGAYKLLAGVLKFNNAITRLDLSGTRVETQAAMALAIALNGNRSITSIDLSNNPLCVFDASALSKGNSPEKEFQGVYALADAVRCNQSLQTIVLEGGVLPVHQLKGLNAKTKMLDLSRQNLTFVSSVFIGALIRENATITELNLNSNDMSPDGMIAVVNQLNASTLKTLDIGNNVRPIETKGAVGQDAVSRLESQLQQQVEQVAALNEAMGRMAGLEKLIIDKNQMGEILSIGKMQSLKTLSISGNKLATLPEDLCQLRSLKKLAVHGNRLYELHTSIGLLTSLETLDVRANQLTYLPTSIGQLHSLKHLDIAENKLSQLVLSICDLGALERIDVKDNPLQRPPLSLAKQGIAAIRRYFQELVKSGETTSYNARVVLLGHGESGKTSLQRGLRAGAARPAGKDERTIQLDIYSMALNNAQGDQIMLSMWDLAGQPQYAAGLQPYIVPGSLYLLTVPALDVSWLDENYSDVLGRWLDYLQTGAPDAVVQLVLTHCDRLLSDATRDRTHEAFAFTASKQVEWITNGIERHQSFIDPEKRTLRVQETVQCISSIAGGEASLTALRNKLENILTVKPPMLPSVGQTIPRTWILAMSYLRSLRDGRDPIAGAKATGNLDHKAMAAAVANEEKEAKEKEKTDPTLATSGSMSARELGSKAYITLNEAKHLWTNEIAARMGLPTDGQVLEDALQLLVNQGEIFASSGIIYLQPNYVTRLLKPLVDHRLGRKQKKGDGPNPLDLSSLDPQRVAMLQPAVDALVKSGELREEILPLLWDPLGLDHDDYGEVLMMMSASGVLFLAEHSQQGRRWVMPMRLPEQQPSDAMYKWNEALENLEEADHLSMVYSIGRITPPGISERLTASCYGFGKYHRFWKRGALIETRENNAPLLLELRRSLGGEHNEHTIYDLCVEIRGKKGARANLWAILLQVREIADTIFTDFPGLRADPELCCPGCYRQEALRAEATRWKVDDVQSRPLRCEKCEEMMSISNVQQSRVDAFSPKKLSLSFEPVSGEKPSGGGGSGPEEIKFHADKLRFGRPIESSQGLYKLLGLESEDELNKLKIAGETAIQDEFDSFNAPGTDDHGWTDLRWLNYLRFEKAQVREPPEGALCPTYDRGHAGMSLDAFTQTPPALASGLKRAHVLALRLYTSPVYRNLSKPLHDGCSAQRPHPYPATVALLTEALKKVRGEQLVRHTAMPSTESAQGVLWCAVSELGDGTSEFKQRGATEIAPLSMSSVRDHVEAHAIGHYMQLKLIDKSLAEASVPTLLRLKADQWQHAGCDISTFSVVPQEKEIVYPPCTYLEVRSEKEETIFGPTNEEMTVKIIEVLPQFG